MKIKHVVIALVAYEAIAYLWNQHSLTSASGSGFLFPLDFLSGKIPGSVGAQ